MSTVRNEVRNLFDNVIVAIDDSEVSLGAIDAIVPNVRAAGGSVTVVYVRHRPMMFDSIGVDSTTAWDVVEDSLEVREHDAEHDATEHLKAQGVPATFIVREGDPGREIISVAKETNASAVVLGSTIHGTIGSILLSSVTEYLVHHCTLPLIIIRPSE